MLEIFALLSPRRHPSRTGLPLPAHRHGAALSALLLGACTVTGDCSSDVSTSVQREGLVVGEAPPPLPEAPPAPAGEAPAAAQAGDAPTPDGRAGGVPTLAEALRLVADIAVTTLSAEALAQRLAPFGPVSREGFLAGDAGFKLTASNAAQHVEAVYMGRAQKSAGFYEIALDFPVEPRADADARFAEVRALLQKAHGKPIPFKLLPGELPSAVWRLKPPFQLFLQMLDERAGRVRVHVGLSVTVDD